MLTSNAYPQLQSIVKLVFYAAAATTLALLVLARLRWRQLSARSDWPLVAWPLAAMMACGALLDLIRSRSAWDISFMIHCAVFAFILVQAIRGGRSRRETGNGDAADK
jgi:hypothetical protein